MMEINLLKFIEERLDEIEENLFHSLLDGAILKNEKYFISFLFIITYLKSNAFL